MVLLTIRDSLKMRDISVEIDFKSDEIYSFFSNGGILGSTGIGKYQINYVGEQIYFFSNELLIYDYSINSENELVLKLNQDLTHWDN